MSIWSLNKSKCLTYLTYTDYSRVDSVLIKKDISPPRRAEPTIVTESESIVEVLKAQTNVYKERLVTSTYIGRNIKQVRNFIFPSH